MGETFGEAVFNTGMTGYQETLTDPSYHKQVVVMTAPQIGNTGVNDEDPESSRIWVSGFVVREPSRVRSNWRSTRSLDDELASQGVVGISGIDTRALTRHLRERGAMRVGIFSGDLPGDAHERVLASPEMVGADLAARGHDRAAVRRTGSGHQALHDRGGRSRHQGGHAPLPGGAGLRGARAAGDRHRRRHPGAQAGRRLLQQRTGRPGHHRRAGRGSA